MVFSTFVFFYTSPDVMMSSIDMMLDLEDNLPDELMSGGSCWNDQVGNKGPGGGGPMNGEDNNGGPPVHVVPNVALQRMHNQQIHHLMQQVNLINLLSSNK
jgi:hypothetical protein